MLNKRGFASDNNSGVSPEVLEMLQKVNSGHVVGYGDDIYTEEATALIKAHFGDKAIPFFTFTGTGANVLSIASVNRSFQSVICAHTAHINEDECGAPEKFSGCKLIAIDSADGKLTPTLIKPHLTGFDFEHRSQPAMISITQPTEMGTLYTVDEIKAISELAKKYNLLLHMDGARLANAAVSLKIPFKQFTYDAGVDILSFGGTKNGLMSAESVIFFDEKHCESFKFFRKQSMQLASKMRYLSAQFIAYLQNDLWKKNASKANKMARYLESQVNKVPHIHITQDVEANGVFATIPKSIIDSLRKEVFFYPWNEETGEVRWMASFDTTEQDVDIFVELLKSYISKL